MRLAALAREFSATAVLRAAARMAVAPARLDDIAAAHALLDDSREPTADALPARPRDMAPWRWLGSVRELLHTDRRRRGAHYTPPPLVDLLLDAALSPLLDRCATADDVLALRVADIACGGGAFLVPVAQRLAARAAVSPAEVVARCIVGVDTDPLAIAVAQLALWLTTGGTAPHVRVGDGLFGDLPRGTFDAVVGNPPFHNAISTRNDAAMRNALRRRFPRPGGTADLAGYFLDRADELARADGTIGLVLPRALLAAPALADLRRDLDATRPPSVLIATDDDQLFDSAAVFVAIVVLGGDRPCRVGLGTPPDIAWRELPGKPRAQTGGRSSDAPSVDAEAEARRHSLAGSRRPLASERVVDSSWWTRIVGDVAPATATRLADRFDVAASMIASEAYDIRAHIVDSPTAAGLKLVTTGLIDPGVCRWGAAVCRYLGADLRHPRIAAAAPLAPALARRLQRARRPKLLVAGLSRRIECVLDPSGEFAGAVSTWTITHATDDALRLAALADWLHSPDIAAHFRAQLGATALGSGNITVTRRFLDNLPLPPLLA